MAVKRLMISNLLQLEGITETALPSDNRPILSLSFDFMIFFGDETPIPSFDLVNYGLIRQDQKKFVLTYSYCTERS